MTAVLKVKCVNANLLLGVCMCEAKAADKAQMRSKTCKLCARMEQTQQALQARGANTATLQALKQILHTLEAHEADVAHLEGAWSRLCRLCTHAGQIQLIMLRIKWLLPVLFASIVPYCGTSFTLWNNLFYILTPSSRLMQPYFNFLLLYLLYLHFLLTLCKAALTMIVIPLYE